MNEAYWQHQLPPAYGEAASDSDVQAMLSYLHTSSPTDADSLYQYHHLRRGIGQEGYKYEEATYIYGAGATGDRGDAYMYSSYTPVVQESADEDAESTKTSSTTGRSTAAETTNKSIYTTQTAVSKVSSIYRNTEDDEEDDWITADLVEKAIKRMRKTLPMTIDRNKVGDESQKYSPQSKTASKSFGIATSNSTKIPFFQELSDVKEESSQAMSSSSTFQNCSRMGTNKSKESTFINDSSGQPKGICNQNTIFVASDTAFSNTEAPYQNFTTSQPLTTSGSRLQQPETAFIQLSNAASYVSQNHPTNFTYATGDARSKFEELQQCLSQISKCLQLAAAGKDGDCESTVPSSRLKCNNNVITKCHVKETFPCDTKSRGLEQPTFYSHSTYLQEANDDKTADGRDDSPSTSDSSMSTNKTGKTYQHLVDFLKFYDKNRNSKRRSRSKKSYKTSKVFSVGSDEENTAHKSFELNLASTEFDVTMTTQNTRNLQQPIALHSEVLDDASVGSS